jgi:hypothetical protein
MILKEFENLPKDFILCANTHIDLPANFNREIRYINSPRELLDIERAIVVIDDAGIWFASRQWDKLDPRIQDKIINNRKDGLRIWVTTQFLEGIDKYIRLNAHQYWEAEKWMGSDEFAPPEKVWGIIRVKRYHPRMHDKIRRKRLETKTFFLRKKYIKLYDTYEKVASRGQKSIPRSEGEKREGVAPHVPQAPLLPPPIVVPLRGQTRVIPIEWGKRAIHNELPPEPLPEVTRADVRAQTADLQRHGYLTEKRKRGRPRKILTE